MSKTGENIYKRKDGRWEARFLKSKEGNKVKYGYVYAKTYNEVKEKLFNAKISYKEKIQNNLCEKHSTFKEWAEIWIDTLYPKIKLSSITKYRYILNNYLFPRISDKIVSKITFLEVNLMVTELQNSGGVKKGSLSPKTVSGIMSVMKTVLELAAENGEQTNINFRKINIKQIQKPTRILSVEEQLLLSNALCNDLTLTNLGILLALYTGLRIGALCALKWDDISFESKCIYVHNTMQRIHINVSQKVKTQIIITQPKSDCSIRTIPIPDKIIPLLYSKRCNAQTFLLTGSTTKYIEPRTMQNRFKSILKKCDIDTVNFHVLRHTFATRCVEIGFDIKRLSEILGHSSVNITLNRYVHPSMELKQKNMNMLSDLLAVK